MKAIITAAVLALLAGPAAYAQQPAPPAARPLTALPANSGTISNYYKQNVYDPSDNKIGEISDVLIDQEGRVNAFIVSVGGFLGAGEKDVAVPFNAVKSEKKNNKWYLVMNTTKDALKSAQGYKYDSNKTQWVPEKS